MMKKIFIVSVVLVSIHTTSIACDVCGTSTSTMGIGLLSDYRSNFVRLTYLHSSFKASPENSYRIRDRFDQYDLSLRYSLGDSKRIRLMANLPLVINQRESKTESVSVRCLSDARLTANYVLLNSIPVGKNVSGHLEAGGGLILPVGKFDEDIHDKNLPMQFNPGRGALAFVWQVNAVVSHKKAGLVFSQNYQWNLDSKSGYHFGNQLNAQLTAFREFNIQEIKIIPNAGFGYERSSADTHANGK